MSNDTVYGKYSLGSGRILSSATSRLFNKIDDQEFARRKGVTWAMTYFDIALNLIMFIMGWHAYKLIRAWWRNRR